MAIRGRDLRLDNRLPEVGGNPQLGYAPDPSQVKAVRALLSHADPGVREAAFRILAVLDPSSARPLGEPEPVTEAERVALSQLSTVFER